MRTASPTCSRSGTEVDFTHFEYVNPAAPKGGELREAILGTFDNYNSIIEKGRLAAGYDIARRLVYDTLLEPAIDEPVSYYGRLGRGRRRGVPTSSGSHSSFGWVRPGTTVCPSLRKMSSLRSRRCREHGSVVVRTALADLDRVFAFGDRELCFVRKRDVEINRTFPFTLGSFSILPKHYWSDRGHRKDDRPGAAGKRTVSTGARGNRAPAGVREARGLLGEGFTGQQGQV